MRPTLQKTAATIGDITPERVIIPLGFVLLISFLLRLTRIIHITIRGVPMATVNENPSLRKMAARSIE
jgi:hypothetical protein